MEFNDLREKYSEIIYKSYSIREEFDKLIIEFEFEIKGLEIFNPRIEILKKEFVFNDYDSNIVKNIIFNIGMVELISYFKCTCSKNIIVECGYLNEEQIKWYKKLYFLGLGEFRFINNIKISEEDFINIIAKGNELDFEENINLLSGNIIPVGGGKDSNLTMELLSQFKDDNLCINIGSKKVAMDCINIAGYDNNKIIEVKRVIDKKLLALNEKGFLNGHTPFSAIVAFITYLMGYLLNKEYVVLSNEDSANESNVEGENINHQYSKSLEFENDFRYYADKYLKAKVEYFSLLRPITEFEIAYLFSKYEKYHDVFKSCNVGSKTEPWQWCCNCPKCLFVFIILSPFLYREKLVNIFGKDMFDNKELLNTFIDLCGYGENKPFECVGTYDEVRFALTKTIKNLRNRGTVKLPFLLDYFDKNFEKNENDNLLKYFNENNNLPLKFKEILRGKLGLC